MASDYEGASPINKAASEYEGASPVAASKEQPFVGEPKLNAMDRGAGQRMLGAEEIVNNTGIGKYIGLPPNDILETARGIAEEQGRGTGIGGAIGEMAGDPLSWAGGAEFKAAKGIPALMKVGGKYGAISGATETGAKDIKENAENALKGGAAGAILTPLVGVGGEKLIKGGASSAKTLAEGFRARAPEALDKASSKMNDMADTAFTSMRKSGVRIIPEKSQQIANIIETELATSTGKNDPALHGGTLKVLKDMQKTAHKGFDIEDLHIYQKRLAQVINKNSVAGGNKEDAMKATVAKDIIDEQLSNLKGSDIPHEALNAINQLHAGKAMWSQMRAFETISDIVKKSDGDPNRMKNLFEQLKNNPRKMRGFTQEDKALIEDAARNATPETLMKMLGKFGVDLGSIRAAASGSALPLVSEVVGGKYGHPALGTGLVAAGTAAKYGQKLTAKAKAERVLKNIENRNPSAIGNAVQPPENPIMKAIGQSAP